MNHCKELYYKTFNHFNDLIFGGQIKPTPKIKSSNNKIEAGYFIGFIDEEDNPHMTIKISKYYNKSYQMFCETMLHEMVHCYQFINNMPVNHGKTFRVMEKIINKELGMRIE